MKAADGNGERKQPTKTANEAAEKPRLTNPTEKNSCESHLAKAAHKSGGQRQRTEVTHPRANRNYPCGLFTARGAVLRPLQDGQRNSRANCPQQNEAS
jgi:hypothetical protein